MKSYQDSAAAFFEAPIDASVERFIDKNVNISLQVVSYLEELDWTQKEFAKKMGKSEAEISKWLSGMHNLTLKSISKMEVVLGRDIILTPLEAKRRYTTIEYRTLKVYGTVNAKVKQPIYSDYTSSEGVFNIMN